MKRTAVVFILIFLAAACFGQSLNTISLNASPSASLSLTDGDFRSTEKDLFLIGGSVKASWIGLSGFGGGIDLSAGIFFRGVAESGSVRSESSLSDYRSFYTGNLSALVQFSPRLGSGMFLVLGLGPSASFVRITGKESSGGADIWDFHFGGALTADTGIFLGRTLYCSIGLKTVYSFLILSKTGDSSSDPSWGEPAVYHHFQIVPSLGVGLRY
jgi:hypothetical protein